MNTYDRVFKPDTMIGHAERNRQSIESTKKMNEEIKEMLKNETRKS